MFTFTICFSILITATIQFPVENHHKPDIEEFIDRLLSSDKFNNLADKIAERAVNKIIILQHENHSEKRVHNVEPRVHESKKHFGEKREQRSEKEVEVRKKEEPKPTKVTTRATTKAETRTEKRESAESTEKPKIDTVAAKQKLKSFPTGPLSLNFKHFTSRLSKSTPANMRHNQAQRENIQEISIKFGKKDEKKGKVYQEFDDENDLLKRVHQDSGEVAAEKAQEDSNVSLDNNASKASKDTSDDSKSSDEKDKIESKSEDSGSKEISDFGKSIETMTVTTKKTKLRTKKSKPTTRKPTKATASDKSDSSDIDIEEFVKDDKDDKTEESSEENKVTMEDSEKSEKGKKGNKDYRHMIREESGKLYAFEQSPDYDEYHDKLAKLLDSVQNKRRSD